jgi:hypothetical protein
MLSLTSGCGPAPVDVVELSQFYRKAEAARPCSEQNTCVFVSPGPCTCSVPVNAQSKQELEAFRDSMSCGKSDDLKCPIMENLRCEEGLCVVDLRQ